MPDACMAACAVHVRVRKVVSEVANDIPMHQKGIFEVSET